MFARGAGAVARAVRVNKTTEDREEADHDALVSIAVQVVELCG